MRIITVFIILFISHFGLTQDMHSYTGGWVGEINKPSTFSFKISIQDVDQSRSSFSIAGDSIIVQMNFLPKDHIFRIDFAENHFFEGIFSDDKQEINGFIKSGLLLYHITLNKNDLHSYTGKWNLLMIDKLLSQKIYLSIENGDKENYQAYPIFGDNRFTGTWCSNFKKKSDTIFFTDFKTGLTFEGILRRNLIDLSFYLGNHKLTSIPLKRSKSEWEIGVIDSSNTISSKQFKKLETLIAHDSLPNTHSVLISRRGKLIYENYFNGYNAFIPHDMRSASKSISSTIVGIAKDQSLLKSTTQSIFDFLPNRYRIYMDTLKSKIDIHSLLTMSSGLDAIDYGINANPRSIATEDNYQRTKDWTASILQASMINKPNTKANYGSANPYLLGLAIDTIVEEPLELFIDQHLFQKLGISNYIIQTDINGRPYFAGGMYLTPLDMLRFGELYIGKGRWQDKRILSQKWIYKSLLNYHSLENVPEKNGYGYLWWHHNYYLDGQVIRTLEARGAGGQYIFLVPSLEMVTVITSGNYKNGKTQQPELLFEKYILPYLDLD